MLSTRAGDFVVDVVRDWSLNVGCDGCQDKASSRTLFVGKRRASKVEVIALVPPARLVVWCEVTVQTVSKDLQH